MRIGLGLQVGRVRGRSKVGVATSWYSAAAYADMAAGADFNNDRYFIPAVTLANVPTATAADLKVKQACTFAEWFAFTAASTTQRTYTDNAGVLKSDLAVDAPRISYANGKRQLRLEDARTNLLFNSGTLTGTGWSASGGTTGTGLAAPDGAASLLFTVTTATSPSQGKDGATGRFAVTASTVYTVSGFFKRGTGARHPYLQINTYNSGLTNIGATAIAFDIDALTVGTPATLVAGLTITGSTVTAIGNGWYRVAATFTTPATTTLLGYYIGPCDTPAASNRSCTVGSTCSLWGGQVEAGAFASDYIPTTTAAVTRAIETARLSPLLEAIMQRSAASVVVRAQGLVQDNGRIIGGATTDAPLMRASNTAVRANKTANLDATLGASGTLTAAHGVALGFDATGRSLTGNGGTIATDANGVGSMTTVYLGRDATNAAGTYGFGYYDFVGISPDRLTDTQLQALAVPA